MIRVAAGVSLDSAAPWGVLGEEFAPAGFPLIGQQGDNLCWAACTAMLDAAQPQPQGATQCAIAASALGRPCCVGGGTLSTCDDPLDQLEITNVLSGYCPDPQLQMTALAQDELDAEIFDNAGAVMIRWTWDGASAVAAHVVLVVGGQRGIENSIYIVHDPKRPSVHYMTYQQLLDAEGRGNWSDSWVGLL